MQLEPMDGEAKAESFQYTEADLQQPTRDEVILGTVIQDVRMSEQAPIQQAQKARWDVNKRLFLFQVEQRRWEGTQTARSALGVPLVLEHINAINPAVMDILFEEDPPFSPVPYPNTPTLVGQALTHIIATELDKAGVETEIELGSNACLLDGTGVWKAYWKYKQDYIGRYLCPHLEFIERQFIRVPANLRRPDIRKGNWRAHVMMMTPIEIDALRSLPGYRNIPPLNDLLALGIEPKETAPSNRLETPSVNYGSMNIASEFDQQERRIPSSIDPRNHPLEVIEYENGKMIYTVLNRKLLIREIENKGQALVRYFSAYFIQVPGQFDGIGLGVLLGNEQMLQQGLINLMLDNLSMSILGMFKRKRGTSVFAQQVRVSPGKVIDVDNIDDIDVLKLPGVDPQAFQAVGESENRAARRSGANEVAVQGSFPQTSGGIGRTAFGMNMLAEAASARIRRYVKVLENQVFVPFLEYIAETNPLFLEKKLTKEILSPELYEVYSKDINSILHLGSKMKFRMLGATKMKRRAAMQKSTEVLLSYFKQPDVLENVKSQMKKVDHDKLSWLLFDAAGWPNKEEIITDMSEEEQMALMSENDLLRELAIMKAKAKIDQDNKMDQIEAEVGGRVMHTVVKSTLEKNQMDDQTKQQTDFTAGRMMAQQQLESEMRSVQEMQGGQAGQRTSR